MNKKQLLEFSKKYAKSQGFKLNPNKKIIDIVLKGLLENEKKYNYRYCPCKIRKKENVCPCKTHKEEIKKDGHCTCYFFVK
jgi:ferredoxin-thioredoxin reductase catalytic subunit